MANGIHPLRAAQRGIEAVLRAARVIPGRALTDSSLAAMFGVGGKTSAGVEVTADRAISGTAVLCAIETLSELTAMLPLCLYRRDGEDRQIERGHPLFGVLHDAPNPEQTAMEFRSSLLASVLLHGNGYAFVVRNGAGQVMELWPVRAENVCVDRSTSGGELAYHVTVNGVTRHYTAQGSGTEPGILHLKGFSTYGVMGLNRIETARDSIGLTLAQEIYAGTFFGNGARPSALVRFPEMIGRSDAERIAKAKTIKAMMAGEHGGPERSNQIMVLDAGGDFKPTSLSPGEAQLIEGRTFQLDEVARLFRIPPHLLANLARSTFSNIEQQALEFVVFCLGPWLKRIEQRVNAQLLSGSERKVLFAEHNVMGLLRGDVAARGAWYRFGLTNGVFSVNEVRRLENMNGIGAEGDKHLVQMNMTPLEMLEDVLKGKVQPQ